MKTQVTVEELSLDESSPEPKKKPRRARITSRRKRTSKARSTGRTGAGKKIRGEEAFPPEQDNSHPTRAEGVALSPVSSTAVVEPSVISLDVENRFMEAIEAQEQPSDSPVASGSDTATLDNFEVTACENAADELQASSEIPAQDNAEAVVAATSEDPALVLQQNRFLLVMTTFWNLLMARLTVVWNWTQQKLRSQGKKRLRVCESVSLGEKRFVAVIQVDGEQFLVGGSSSSVATLAHLERPREFSSVFQQHCEQDFSRA